MKKICFLIISFVLLISNVKAEDLDIQAQSAILINYETGDILYKKNESEKLAPASMTKIMSLIIIMDNIENKKLSLDEKVEISQNASSMGGSQIFLQPNTKEKVNDLIKAITVASANELAVSIKQSHLLKEEIII